MECDEILWSVVESDSVVKCDRVWQCDMECGGV